LSREEDVVARLLGSQVVLEQQRLALGTRDRRLDTRDLPSITAIRVS
jgi:hypothetical protein